MTWVLRKKPLVKPTAKIQPIRPIKAIQPIKSIKPIRPLKPLAPLGSEYYWKEDNNL